MGEHRCDPALGTDRPARLTDARGYRMILAYVDTYDRMQTAQSASQVLDELGECAKCAAAVALFAASFAGTVLATHAEDRAEMVGELNRLLCLAIDDAAEQQ